MDERNLINAIIFTGTTEASKCEIQLISYYFVSAFFFIGLLVAVIVMMRTMKPICQNDANECKQSYCHKLKENDFKYCIGILFLIIVFICTLTMGNNSKVMEYISFAGTVSSLILSVLAIIMTMLSESKNEGTKANIDVILSETRQSVDKINNFTGSMESVSSEIHKTTSDLKVLKLNLSSINKRTLELKEGLDLLKDFIDKSNALSTDSDEIKDLTNEQSARKPREFNIKDIKKEISK